VVYPVLEFREKKKIFSQKLKVERGNINFFLLENNTKQQPMFGEKQ
jgi:hypothetical protein